MDRKFLEEITEGYITNHDVFSDFKPNQVDLIRETIYTDLCEVCDQLRCEDQELYNSVYFNNRFYQNGVFENYLNIRYKSEAKQAVEEAEVLEEGVATGLMGIALGMKGVATGMMALISKFIVFLGTMSAASYLLLIAFFAIVFTLYGNAISKQVFKTLHGLGILFEKFGKAISKSGKGFQLRYAIIQKNFDHCYQRAGIDDLNKIKMSNYLNKGSGSKQFKWFLSQKEAHILINCYVEVLLDMIKLQLVMYLNCIKSSKGFDEITKLSAHEFMAYIQSSQYKSAEFNVNAVCNEYFEIATEQISKFDDVIEFFYEKESEKRQITQRLIKTVESAQNEITRIQQDTRKFSNVKNASKKLPFNPKSNTNKQPYNNKKRY